MCEWKWAEHQTLVEAKVKEITITLVPVMLSGYSFEASWEALQISCTITTVTATCAKIYEGEVSWKR